MTTQYGWKMLNGLGCDRGKKRLRVSRTVPLYIRGYFVPFSLKMYGNPKQRARSVRMIDFFSKTASKDNRHPSGPY